MALKGAAGQGIRVMEGELLIPERGCRSRVVSGELLMGDVEGEQLMVLDGKGSARHLSETQVK